MDVVVWLRSLGLERYEAAFRENEIDERVLLSLTLEDLKEIGVGPVGHRRMLLEAITALRGDTGGITPSAEVPATSSTPNVSPEDRAEPPSYGDVLRPGRFNGTIGAHGP